MNAGFAGQRQLMGVDLARRRRVIARIDADGTVLECVQIDNSPAVLVAEVGKAGPAAPVAVEARVRGASGAPEGDCVDAQSSGQD